ncbi:MAG: CPBP family intramembrane glutamic endopeptidase [Trueperaceae bacterium]
MGFALLRVALLFGAAAATAALVSLAAGVGFSLALTPQLSALYFIPVNVLCLWLLRRNLHARGSSLRSLADYDGARLGEDVLKGLLWLVVLFVPFIIAINLTMLVLFGPAGMLAAYETVFAPDPAASVAFAPWFAWTSAILVALVFPLTNAPTEELVYRGHAQAGLLRAGRPAALAMLLPAAAFGLQHVLLAPSAAGMLVYAVGFFSWGAVAGLIYLRSGRLMPLILAHLITNGLTSLAPLAFLLAGVSTS